MISVRFVVDVDSKVDCVLLINVLAHIHTDDRSVLFHELMSHYLNDRGYYAVLKFPTFNYI